MRGLESLLKIFVRSAISLKIIAQIISRINRLFHMKVLVIFWDLERLTIILYAGFQILHSLEDVKLKTSLINSDNS